jgi:hypothetical protein
MAKLAKIRPQACSLRNFFVQVLTQSILRLHFVFCGFEEVLSPQIKLGSANRKLAHLVSPQVCGFPICGTYSICRPATFASYVYVQPMGREAGVFSKNHPMRDEKSSEMSQTFIVERHCT